MPTYKINLIEPYALKEDELEKLGEELKHLFKAVSLSNDKIKLNKYILETEFFGDCPLPTAKMINALFEIKLDSSIEKYKKEDGGINMHEVMMEIKEDWKKEGILEGRAEGIAETIIKMGKEFSLNSEEIILRIMKECNLTKEEAKEKISKFQA